MPRAAPKDRQYAPTYAATFTNLSADADLTAVHVEAPYACSETFITVPASFAGGSFVFRTQGSSTDVTLPIPAVAATGGYIIGPIRAAIVAIDETTTDGLVIMCLWQGGPS
jgi:hypothetical protein